MAFVLWLIISFLLGGFVGFIGFRRNSHAEISAGSERDPTNGLGSDQYGRRG
jgi:hypothetical protein